MPTQTAPPPPTIRPGDLTEVRLGGRNYLRPGDPVRVKPSRPGRHDGYVGTVRRIIPEAGDVVVEVGGAPAGRAVAVRTFRLARLARTQAETR